MAPAAQRLVTDSAKLHDIARNLIENAVNYTPEGGSIDVRADVREGRFQLTVADTGHGIAPDDLGRVFERFYRVDAARSRTTGGTGLGLAIVKHVCASHGGECVVWSNPGDGSTFTLRLPAYPDESGEQR